MNVFGDVFDTIFGEVFGSTVVVEGFTVEVQGGAEITDAGTDAFTIPLEGTGETYDRVYIVTNTGDSAITFNSVVVTEGWEAVFTPSTLDPDETLSVTIRIPSDVAGSLTSGVSFNTSAGGFDFEIEATVSDITSPRSDAVWRAGRRPVTWRIPRRA